MDNAIDAINKGRIYKNILNPWTDEDIVTIAREASELYHLRTDLNKKSKRIQRAIDPGRTQFRRIN